ncbi:MAG: hypothetical protein H0T46_27780 [Deltaproteobacteria bacterium]|nr:hypothetical protein [Deltaproteobacteria bacterium]
MKRLLLTTITVTALGTKLVMSNDPVPLSAPASTAPPIVFSIPAPTLVMIRDFPPSPPPTKAAPPAPPPPAARSPFLDAACLVGGSEMPSCSWDIGFPAISADGSTMAVGVHPGDSARGYPAYEIMFVDVANPRKRTTHPILIADEYTGYDEPLAAEHRTKVVARVAMVQRELDRGGYRSTVPLGSKDDPMPGVTTFRTDHDGEYARLIDNTTNTVVWERRFDVTKEFTPRPLRDDEEGSCTPTETVGISLAFDPATRTLLAQVSYMGGPCWCDSVMLPYTYRLP